MHLLQIHLFQIHLFQIHLFQIHLFQVNLFNLQAASRERRAIVRAADTVQAAAAAAMVQQTIMVWLRRLPGTECTI